jgi:hypothetical protein
VTAIASALLTWLTGGSALAALGKVTFGVASLVLGLNYRRYLGILGADRRRPAERQTYDALRESLAYRTNAAARIYADRLTAFLDRVDCFFGDAGIADRTLFPRAFGLRTPAPLWTAPAFDRCLLLAFIYPFLMIFLIWTISGHGGSIETTLHLKSDLPGWRRGAILALAIFPVILLCWTHIKRQMNKFIVIVIVSSTFLLVFSNVLTQPSISLVLAVGVALALCFQTPSYAGVTAITFFCLIHAVPGFIALHLPGLSLSTALGILSTIATGFGGVSVLWFIIWSARYSVKHGRTGTFFLLFIPAAFSVCVSAANLLSRSSSWEEIDGPIILILGLLTLINAPFDWFAFGLTRALLRRGLELGGWWPYALALVDAALAAIVIAALTLAMMIGVQAFDELAVRGGGKAVLPLGDLFRGIEAHPGAPEYWWAYALLLSTMIPSLVNLVIGGASLVRGVPGVSALLLRFIPERGNVPKFDRAWIAAVLTAQVGIGAALGIAAQAFLALVIIGYVMPWIGLDLLEMAKVVAAYDLPARVAALVAGI